MNPTQIAFHVISIFMNPSVALFTPTVSYLNMDTNKVPNFLKQKNLRLFSCRLRNQWSFTNPKKCHSNKGNPPKITIILCVWFDSPRNGVPSRKLTYPPDKAYLKMIFLFRRWDMLVPWRVKSFDPWKRSQQFCSKTAAFSRREGCKQWRCWPFCCNFSRTTTFIWTPRCLEVMKNHCPTPQPPDPRLW